MGRVRKVSITMLRGITKHGQRFAIFVQPMNSSSSTFISSGKIRMMTHVCKMLLAIGAIALCAQQVFASGDFQGSTHMVAFDEGTQNYNKATPDDAIAQLQKWIEADKADLRFSKERGYLDSLLAKLKIPQSSQVLVFSKTSLQRDRISPGNPRAIYFNDDVYLGFIPGAPMIEISAAEPKMGGVFYTLDQTAAAQPKFVRQDQCLDCHASARSMGVPGHLLRSLKTDENGSPELSSGTSEVNHRTPIEERWGGWYVTGQHGEQLHRGNLVGKAAFEKHEKTPNYRGNISDLSKFFDASHYPAKSSDIVALMVLEHQVHMHNFITRLRYETDQKLAAYGHINYVTNIAESFLKYMLFTEEAPMESAIEGNTSFANDFAAQGPFDSKGRSLRQFDLQTRMFKYPCSYLIYSKAFEAIPGQMKDYVYQRLHDILTGKDASADYARISRKQGREILKILVETKKDLPAYWKD